MSSLVFGLLVFTIWAVGLFGGGFALAGDVDKVRRHQLETRLDNVHGHLCMSGSSDTDMQLIALARELEREYLEVNNGQGYSVNCELLLKLRQ